MLCYAITARHPKILNSIGGEKRLLSFWNTIHQNDKPETWYCSLFTDLPKAAAQGHRSSELAAIYAFAAVLGLAIEIVDLIINPEHNTHFDRILGQDYFFQAFQNDTWYISNMRLLGINLSEKRIYFSNSDFGNETPAGKYPHFFFSTDGSGNWQNITHMGKFEVGRFLIRNIAPYRFYDIKNEQGQGALKTAIETSDIRVEDMAYINPDIALQLLIDTTGLPFATKRAVKPRKVGGDMKQPVYLSWECLLPDDPVPTWIIATYRYKITPRVGRSKQTGWELEFKPLEDRKYKH